MPFPLTDGATKDWPHAPVHRLDDTGVFMVTAGTLHKHHYFRGAEKLTILEDRLLSLAKSYCWQLEAWAVFSNHYHFIARSHEQSGDLGTMIRQLHVETSGDVNRLDRTEGRQVWFNFWDTKLTFQHSYLARLKYVHQNPVKHGLVKDAREYHWCSAAWFDRVASPAMARTIDGFKIDSVKVYDEFD